MSVALPASPTAPHTNSAPPFPPRFPPAQAAVASGPPEWNTTTPGTSGPYVLHPSPQKHRLSAGLPMHNSPVSHTAAVLMSPSSAQASPLPSSFHHVAGVSFARSPVLNQPSPLVSRATSPNSNEPGSSNSHNNGSSRHHNSSHSPQQNHSPLPPPVGLSLGMASPASLARQRGMQPQTPYPSTTSMEDEQGGDESTVGLTFSSPATASRVAHSVLRPSSHQYDGSAMQVDPLPASAAVSHILLSAGASVHPSNAAAALAQQQIELDQSPTAADLFSPEPLPRPSTVLSSAASSPMQVSHILNHSAAPSNAASTILPANPHNLTVPSVSPTTSPSSLFTPSPPALASLGLILPDSERFSRPYNDDNRDGHMMEDQEILPSSNHSHEGVYNRGAEGREAMQDTLAQRRKSPHPLALVGTFAAQAPSDYNQQQRSAAMDIGLDVTRPGPSPPQSSGLLLLPVTVPPSSLGTGPQKSHKQGGAPPNLPPLPSWCGLPNLPHGHASLSSPAGGAMSFATVVPMLNTGHTSTPTKRLKTTPLSSPSSSRPPRLQHGDTTQSSSLPAPDSAFSFTNFPSPRSAQNVGAGGGHPGGPKISALGSPQHGLQAPPLHPHTPTQQAQHLPYMGSSHVGSGSAGASSGSQVNFFWELRPFSTAGPAPIGGGSADSVFPVTSTSYPPLPLWSKASWVFGRHTSSDHIVEHISISRHHARMLIHCVTGQLYLQDLNSTHGTFVDGQRITSMRSSAATGSYQLPTGDGGIGSFALASTPSPSTAGAFPLTPGARVSFGACTKTFTVHQYDSFPWDTTSEPMGLGKSEIRPPTPSSAGSSSLGSASSAGINDPHAGSGIFSSGAGSPRTTLLAPTGAGSPRTLGMAPALRKTLSDGSIPNSIPNSPLVMAIAGGGMIFAAAAGSEHGSAVDGETVSSEDFPPLPATASLERSLTSSLSSNTLRSQRKRKTVSFAPAVKRHDGALEALVHGGAAMSDAAPGTPGGGNTSAASETDMDDQEDRPKRQGCTAEEITRARRQSLLAAAVPVPILKLPVFPFSSRASSAPASAGGLPTLASSIVSTPRLPVLGSMTTNAATPRPILPVSAGGVLTDTLETPMPMADRDISGERGAVRETPAFAFPSLLSATGHTSAAFSNGIPASLYPSSNRTGLKRPFEEDEPDAQQQQGSAGPTPNTPGLSTLPAAGSFGYLSESAPAGDEDDGQASEMQADNDEEPEREQSSMTMDTTAAPSGPGAAMSISIGVTMQDRQMAETQALYSALLPQPINSPASASSFTSLSLMSSSVQSQPSFQTYGHSPHQHTPGPFGASPHPHLASPHLHTPGSQPPQQQLTPPFGFSPSQQLAQFNSQQMQQQQQYPNVPAAQQLRTPPQ